MADWTEIDVEQEDDPTFGDEEDAEERQEEDEELERAEQLQG
jgi:hypothetical protein